MSVKDSLGRLWRETGNRRALLAETGRFLIIGAGATLLDFMLFWGLVRVFPASGKICFAIAFFTSVGCRFFADKLFTFRDGSKKVGLQLPLYVASTVCTMLIGLGVYSLCVRLGSGPLLAKFISMPFVTAAGYILFKFLVFTGTKVE